MFSVILRFLVLSICFVRDMHLVSLWYRLLRCRRSTSLQHSYRSPKSSSEPLAYTHTASSA